MVEVVAPDVVDSEPGTAEAESQAHSRSSAARNFGRKSGACDLRTRQVVPRSYFYTDRI